MADGAFLPPHPLSAHLPQGAPSSATVAGAGVRLRLPEQAFLYQILAFTGREPAVRRMVAGLAKGNVLAVRDGLPAEWLILATDETVARLSDAFGDDAAVIDQSHGRVGIVLEGCDVRALLAKGTAVDLHPDAFAAGRSVNTLFGRFAVHLTRTDEDRFELIVARSFAESLLEMLVEAGREFGITTG